MRQSSPIRYYFLLLLCIEKFVQHIYVTYAFAENISAIRDDVVLDYRIFMYLGFIIAFVFLTAGYGIYREKIWGLNLFWALGWFDFIGEHVAQGGSLKFTPLSYILAIVIIILVPLHKRGMRKKMIEKTVE